MKEKKKDSKEQQAGGGGSFPFGSGPSDDNKMVTISSGPYVEELPVAGMKVGEIRKKFAVQFDIAEGSQAVVNGNVVDDNYTTQYKESVMFIQHAGEKGAMTVKLEGSRITAKTPEGKEKSMEIQRLVERIAPTMSTGSLVMPAGVKAVLSKGNVTILVYEQCPSIQQLRWIASDSKKAYGPGTKYRNVRISLPYLLILGVFVRDAQGLPSLACTDECFFRNERLGSLEDELSFPALLNCSKYPHQGGNIPLSWICTQYLKQEESIMGGPDANARYRSGMEAIRYCLLETGFNLSSEHHEGNSWYGASKEVIPQIKPIEEWEKRTQQDPLFVLDLPWIKTGLSVRQVAERIFARCSANQPNIQSTDDVARIVLNS